MEKAQRQRLADPAGTKRAADTADPWKDCRLKPLSLLYLNLMNLQ